VKKFVVILSGKKRGELTKALLNRHADHLRRLKREGKLFLCGPFQDDDGAIQILVCSGRDEAINLVESDPFIKEGYYASYEVHEWLEANEENNWLIE
jgi:uncharacterized protein YciI